MWESGNISGFTFNPLDDVENFVAVKCLANPSGDTSGTQYQVTAVFKETGHPIGASCSCVAGLGEACTHIAGLMFGIEDFVSRGYKTLPENEAATEKLCKWIVPRGPKVEPKPLRSVSIKKNIPGKNRENKIFTAASYNPVPLEARDVNFEDLTALHHSLGLNNPDLPWVKGTAPAILKKYNPNRNEGEHTPAVTNLPDTVECLDPLLVPACEVKIVTQCEPVPLKAKLKAKASHSGEKSKVTYSLEDKTSIEKITRKQADSVSWHNYRQGLITASNFSKVASHIRTVEKSGPNATTAKLTDSLINGSKFKGNIATRYGKKMKVRQQKHTYNR